MGRLAAFWSSLKCTVILLLGLALLCVAGTVIPQHAVTPVVGQGLSAWFLSRLMPTDLYHSLWLTVLAGLLCLNVVLCMLLRIRARQQRIPAPRFGDAAEISLGTECQAMKALILKTAPRALRFQERQEGDSILLFGDSESLRRPAIFGLHASVLLIFVGMLMSTFGLDGHIELSEGQTAAQFADADGRPKALGFSVRCDQFRIQHYDNGMPKEYVSRLAFLENGAVRASGELRVNHPLAYQGLRFYQETYRAQPAAIFTVTDGVHAWSIRAREGDELTMDDGKLRFQIEKIGEDVMHMGPALKLVFDHASGHRHLWLFQELDRIKEAVPDLFERAPSFNPSLIKPYTFALMEFAPEYATGIGVKRDPGAAIVAVGGVMMLICLLIVFLIPSLRVWVRLEERAGTTILKAAAGRGGKSEAFPAVWMARIRRAGGA